VKTVADEFSDGVWFVPLAAISDPALVGPATASARRSRGDRRGIAFLLTMKGWCLVELGEAARGRPMVEEAVALKRGVGERQLLAFAQAVLAIALLAEERTEEAVNLIVDEALPAFRTLGDGWGAGLALYTLGRAHEELGNPDRAIELCRESLSIRREMGDRHGAGRCLERLEALGASVTDQTM
jgi:tetratricopeptide (TPR) repeat protein